MDKFVCGIPAGQDHVTLTRADVHSSVIKRLHEDMEPGKWPDQEKAQVKESPGFCECGWPYNMLVPRGKKAGEEYVLFVMATDNNIDSIGIRTSCGSMSYCGAKGQDYPDSRNMGYPFVNPVYYNGKPMDVPSAFDNITNAAYKTFIIENDVSEPPPLAAVDIWSPFDQLRVNDGTMRRAPPGGVTEYIHSELVGTFRVLVDNDYCVPSEDGKKLYVRFQGRGPGGGSYVVSDVSFAPRDGEKAKIKPDSSVKVTVKGESSFTVPESGVLSDAIDSSLDPASGDYFVTFRTESPGIYLPTSQTTQTCTYFLPPQIKTPEPNKDWNEFASDLGRFAYVQCVSAIMAESSDVLRALP